MRATSEPASLRRPVPGPRGLDLVATLYGLRGNYLSGFDALTAKYGDVWALPGPRYTAVHLGRPEHVRHVLLERVASYPKSLNYEELELALGKGLLTSEGAFWKRQRRIAQPAFGKRRVGVFAPLFARFARELAEAWDRRGDAPFDLHAETVDLTLRIAGQTLFSVDLSDRSARLGRAVDEVLPFAVQRMDAIVQLPLWLPLPSHLRAARWLRVLDGEVDGIISERERCGEADAPRDLLSALCFASDPETGERMSRRQLRDEVVTFLLAGHETTANALAWTLWQLAGLPDLSARLQAEWDAVLGERLPDADSVQDLDLTRRVLLESMRLYPPAWVVERQALEDDVVDGWEIPKGTLVMLCQWTTHRHPDLWDDPLTFDPDRFLPERVAARPRGAYFPFGLGQRQCIGETFALLEMLVVLPLLLRGRRLEAAAPVELDAGITLRPRAGMQVRSRPWGHPRGRG